MKLSTERLVLRNISEKDAQDILNLRSNEIVNQFIKRIPPKNIEDAEKFVNTILQNEKIEETFYWGISLKNNSQIIGTICLWRINLEKKYAELGYELLPNFHGKGIMNEAVHLVLDFAFKNRKFEEISAFTNKNNLSSINLLLKNNFVLEKDKKDEGFPDNIIFSLKNSQL